MGSGNHSSRCGGENHHLDQQIQGNWGHCSQFRPGSCCVTMGGRQVFVRGRYHQLSATEVPFGPTLILKKMTIAESQQMGILFTGIERITYIINRCTIYELLHLHNQQPDPDAKLALKNLKGKLVTLYALVLTFLVKAIQTYGKGAASKTFLAIFNSSILTDFLNDCQMLEQELEYEVNNCDRLHTRRVQTMSDQQIQNLKQFLIELQSPIFRMDAGVAVLCQKLDNSERLDILQWISEIKYEEDHIFARQGWTDGTGEWLLKHERYRIWRGSSISGILWLHGNRKHLCVSFSIFPLY